MTMHSTVDQSPIFHLYRMELQGKWHAKPLPQQGSVKAVWSGIGFRLGQLKLVVPMEQVLEVLKYPRVTRVPGSKKWVRGVANIRGDLLPVIDMLGFLGGYINGVKKDSRVFVVKQQGIAAGLLIDELYGIQSFLEEQRDDQEKVPEAAIEPYISGSFGHANDRWWLIDLESVCKSRVFFEVAA